MRPHGWELKAPASFLGQPRLGQMREATPRLQTEALVASREKPTRLGVGEMAQSVLEQ